MLTDKLRSELEGFVSDNNATIARFEKDGFKQGGQEAALLARLRKSNEFFQRILSNDQEARSGGAA
jgi:hypothetical protein